MLNKKCLFFFVFVSLLSLRVYAQDSVALTNKKWYKTKLVKATTVPLALTAVGLYTASKSAVISKYDIKNDIEHQFPDFTTTIEDYLRYVPPASVFVLDLAGVKAKHNFRDRVEVFLKANVFTLALAFPLKGATQVKRPDNSSSASFPSLHTAQAFLGAVFLHKEYGHKSIAYPIVGYTLATTTGVFRMLNNKHWLSDVLVGAAVGIFSANIAYATHRFNRKRKRKNKNSLSLTAFPTYNRGPGLALIISN